MHSLTGLLHHICAVSGLQQCRLGKLGGSLGAGRHLLACVGHFGSGCSHRGNFLFLGTDRGQCVVTHLSRGGNPIIHPTTELTGFQQQTLHLGGKTIECCAKTPKFIGAVDFNAA